MPRRPNTNAGPGRDVLRLLLVLWCVGAVLMAATDSAEGAVTGPAFVAVRAVALAALGMALDAALWRVMTRPVGRHAWLRIAGAPIVIAMHAAADLLGMPWLIRAVGGTFEPGLRFISSDPFHAGATSLIIGSSVVVYALLHVLRVACDDAAQRA